LFKLNRTHVASRSYTDMAFKKKSGEGGRNLFSLWHIFSLAQYLHDILLSRSCLTILYLASVKKPLMLRSKVPIEKWLCDGTRWDFDFVSLPKVCQDLTTIST